MPDSVFAAASSRFSRLLHQLVYSLPSPDRTIPGSSAPDPSTGLQVPKQGLEEFLNEPGESRALAGGIGPLSFAGSGYGIMLVMMVGQVLSMSHG